VKRLQQRHLLDAGKGSQIASFRQRALELGTKNEYEREHILARLHGPTVQMRSGELFDEARFLQVLSNELAIMRQEANTTVSVMSMHS
jgi:hypothetical protein